MEIRIPEYSLIVLIGASGSGKSTFAQRHFKPSEILSSDYLRGVVSDDETSQDATEDAFDVLHYILEKRLRNKKLTVIDATNVQQEARKGLRRLAKKYHTLVGAIVFDMPEALCHERNEARPDRNFGRHVVKGHIRQLRRSLKFMKEEGLRVLQVFKSPEELEDVTIVREKLWNDRTEVHGPFDIIGDVHGCAAELHQLLGKLGYEVKQVGEAMDATRYAVSHPDGRRLIFVGDLVDRGPDSPGVLRLAMDIVDSGAGFCVPGNHDVKLLRKLNGKNVKLNHGLPETLEQLEGQPEAFIEGIKSFIKGLVSHLIFEDGNLLVAHAGLKEDMHGRTSGSVRAFCLYGETTGETDSFGLPIRHNWAADYRGETMVVYGHTPIPRAEWLNRTVNIDTGCVFGGKLTALRYPEKEFVSVDAAEVYCEPMRPLEMNVPEIGTQHAHDEVLDFTRLRGKNLISTRLNYYITMREEHALAAMEVTNRFGVNPKWMIYLPPTMSPPKSSRLGNYLEHPAEAFTYYQKKGLSEVVIQEKHMGSRAVVIVCKDESVVRERFGISDEGIGIVYTRTGRAFFKDKALEQALLKRLRSAVEAAGLWEALETDWLCLDCELMPWNVKAIDLLKRQYAAAGAAGSLSYPQVNAALEAAAARGIDLGGLQAQYAASAERHERYKAAYRGYCWSVPTLDDLKLAPFHLLASEGAVHMDKPHPWHMEQIHALCKQDSDILLATDWHLVDLDSAESIQEAIAWWEAHTQKGGEGMVVKPFNYLTDSDKDLIQPAIKVRGSDYLRIIYGPDYDSQRQLDRLRNRSLKVKRGMAIRELALGHEALHRFNERLPLIDVHECVYAILGLESTPVDPRL